MSSAPNTTDTAEQRFRAAFERLKGGESQLLPINAPVSQNNVAKEAGTDPSALKKSRYPALIREIQAWIEINGQQEAAKRERQKQKQAREDMTEKVDRLTAERDNAQSQLVSSHRVILELLQKNAMLQARLDEVLPPPTPLRK